MFLALPEPDPAVLKDAPATLVAFTVGIEQERPLRPADGVQWSRLLSEAGFASPVLQKVEEQAITVGQTPGGNATVLPGSLIKREGWKITQSGEPGSATAYADGLTIDRPNYPGFEVFSKELQGVLGAFEALLSPSIEKKISLKYANALSSQEARSASFWEDKVELSFLGIAADARLRDDIFRTLSAVEFKIEDGIIVSARFGLQPDAVFESCVAYVFEVEVTDFNNAAFSVEHVLARAAMLNRRARQLFQAILTPKYFETLKNGRS